MSTPEPQADHEAMSSRRRRGLIGQTLGNCRIDEKIGQGAMGAVFRGHHLGLDVPVAVKVLPPSFAKRSQKHVDRFIREARSAAKLRHMNIVRVLNVGHEKGVYFLIMDYVDGESLQKRVNRDGTLPVDRTLSIIAQVADALEMARCNNIVHRDIKPDNILMDQTGTPKLVDLGLAKEVDADHDTTQDGSALGTPHYMSPEQVEDAARADHRSDLYSLGTTLFRLVCGQVPFQGKSSFQVMRKHVSAPIPDPRQVNPKLPKPVATLIQILMAKAPEDRYQTAAELIEDIRRVEAGKPLQRKLAAAGALPAAGPRGPRARTRVQRPAQHPHTPLYIGGGVAAALLGLGLLYVAFSHSDTPPPEPGPARIAPAQPAPPPEPAIVAVKPEPKAQPKPQPEPAPKPVPKPQPKPKPAPATRPAHVPIDAVAMQGHWYKVFTEGVRYWEARKQCEQMGGYLARIESAKENAAVANLAQGKRVWIGGTDEMIEGEWRWRNGKPMTYFNWQEKEPNNAGNYEHYIQINHRKKGLWNDAGAGRRVGFVCEWDHERFKAPPPSYRLMQRLLVRTGPDWVEVKKPGKPKPHRFKVKWSTILKKTDLDKLPPLIRTGMTLDKSNCVICVRPYRPWRKKGKLQGTIVHKGRDWIEVKPDPRGAVEAYRPRGTNPKPPEGGPPDRKMLSALRQYKVGDKVSMKWEYDTCHRVVEISKREP